MNVGRFQKPMLLGIADKVVFLYLVESVPVCIIVEPIISSISIHNDVPVRISISHPFVRKVLVSRIVVDVVRNLEIARLSEHNIILRKKRATLLGVLCEVRRRVMRPRKAA